MKIRDAKPTGLRQYHCYGGWVAEGEKLLLIMIVGSISSTEIELFLCSMKCHPEQSEGSYFPTIIANPMKVGDAKPTGLRQ
jgi:hypothetical protein